ncbi:Lrp/AsnC ligand binding domain-containing protein [Rheinheimera muenzenbergensis]|uniref:Leucine-responsive regulatory protein n=1 Tax=Rheinheimera muenzenbergensis TaxID=1193628 RepID=A0ABU8C3V4_9GAMM|nr:Lrp/AsnC ligand binding domain-containing protein [Gammaproteobacteria bacterium]MBU1553240.1 Lrp/AsnC ligand binding domain-containing protein [Gammaproteobacteria bacterium]MBU2069021.1 Lrp/AsnC ligand binding domain-containing protein [Gammaproteobacteria bacterium]MBU2183244.1 Lrp/AsnC ligand binding domain-containing protein [Gammaproteobacteria bacterium]MBU2204623.1 Lrp/AsnC ligand binding domain-containing protein [Gammaproteobacteria bacterium]
MNTPVKNKALDRIDISILDTLQRDGRIANVDLAKKVNLSASPCIDRVKRLEKEGYIEGYGARLNAAKMGLGTAAFIQVTLDRTTSEVFDQFRDAVVQIPQVAECHMVAGGFDYLLKLRLPNMDAYRSILAMIVDLPGVAQTHTYVVIEQVKSDNGLPVKTQDSPPVVG